jgi:hypothetical protein
MSIRTSISTELSKMRRIWLLLALLACAPLAADAYDGGGAQQHGPTLHRESFHPPVMIPGPELLVSITTITDIPGYPGLVMHVPCFMPTPQPHPTFEVNGTASSAKADGKASFGSCEAQRLPGSTLLIDQNGDKITPPP